MKTTMTTTIRDGLESTNWQTLSLEHLQHHVQLLQRETIGDYLDSSISIQYENDASSKLRSIDGLVRLGHVSVHRFHHHNK